MTLGARGRAPSSVTIAGLTPMDDPILNRALPEKQPDLGPWSPGVLTRRALADLAEIAAAMHRRQREPRAIELALARQAALWSQRGAAVPDGAALATVRQLPGLSRWHWRDGIDPDTLADGIELPSEGEHARRCRAYTLAAWLRRHAGTVAAEAVVRDVERGIVARLEGAA